MTISIRVLGSTSSGNCTLIWQGENALLVDCGLGMNYTRSCLLDCGLDWYNIKAVLITHAHRDHIRDAALRRIHKESQAPVISSAGIIRAMKGIRAIDEAVDQGRYKTHNGEPFEIGPFAISGFEVQHDSVGGCWGYRIRLKQGQAVRQIAVATDIARADAQLARHLSDSDILVIESNHDINMLETSNRPWHLKKRIKEDGHLSNDECAQLLEEVLMISETIPRAVFLAHVSQECNTNEHALQRAAEALTFCRVEQTVKLCQTYRDKASETFKL